MHATEAVSQSEVPGPNQSSAGSVLDLRTVWSFNLTEEVILSQFRNIVDSVSEHNQKSSILEHSHAVVDIGPRVFQLGFLEEGSGADWAVLVTEFKNSVVNKDHPLCGFSIRHVSLIYLSVIQLTVDLGIYYQEIIINYSQLSIYYSLLQIVDSNHSGPRSKSQKPDPKAGVVAGWATMSTEQANLNKRPDAPPTTYSLAADVTDLESRVELIRHRLEELDPSAPDGKLRQVRRKVRANGRTIDRAIGQLQQLEHELKEIQESVRRTNNLHQSVMELQADVAGLKEGSA